MDKLLEEVAEKLLEIAEDYKDDRNKLKVYRRYKAVKDSVSNRFFKDGDIELLKKLNTLLTQGYNLLLNGNKTRVLTKLADEIRKLQNSH